MRIEMVVFRKFSPPVGFPNSITQGWWFISEASFSKTPLRWSSFELQRYGDYSNSAGFYYVCINFSVSKCTALSTFPDVIRNCIIPTSQSLDCLQCKPEDVLYLKYEPRNGDLLITKFKMNFPLVALEKRKRPIAVASKNQHSSSLCSLPRKETNSLFSF